MAVATANRNVSLEWKHGMLRDIDPAVTASVCGRESFQDRNQDISQGEFGESVHAIYSGIVEVLQYLIQAEQFKETLPQSKFRLDGFTGWLAGHSQRNVQEDRNSAPIDGNGGKDGSNHQQSSRSGGQSNGQGQHLTSAEDNRTRGSNSANLGAGRFSGSEGGDDGDEDGQDQRRASGFGKGHYRDAQNSLSSSSGDSEKEQSKRITDGRQMNSLRGVPDEQAVEAPASHVSRAYGNEDVVGDPTLPSYEGDAENNQHPSQRSLERPRSDAEFRDLIEHAVRNPDYTGWPFRNNQTEPYEDLSARAVEAATEIYRRRAEIEHQSGEETERDGNVAAHNDRPSQNADLNDHEDQDSQPNPKARLHRPRGTRKDVGPGTLFRETEELAAVLERAAKPRRANQHSRWDVHPDQTSRTAAPGAARQDTNSKRKYNTPDNNDENEAGDHDGVDDMESQTPKRAKNTTNRASGGAGNASASTYPQVDIDGLAALPQGAQDYFHRAYNEWKQGENRSAPINAEKMYQCVERLYYAFGRDPLWIWNNAPALSQYVDRFGKEQWGVRSNLLLRNTFTRLEDDLIAAGYSQDIREQFSGFYTRLQRIQSSIPSPPRLPFDRPVHEVIQAYHTEIEAAESRQLRRQWQRFIATLEGQNNGLGAMNARMHFLEAEKQFKMTGNLTWPTSAPQHAQEVQAPLVTYPAPHPMPEGWGRLEAQALGFDYPQVQGHWCFDRSLGEGGQGHAGLWVKFDKDGTVLDRKAVKETWCDDATWAYEPVWMPPKASRFPREWWVQGTMTFLPGPTNMVKGVQCQIYAIRQMYRIYMEFCPHGDVSSLIKRHRKMCTIRDQHGAEMRHAFTIPNVVIWSLFEALARAACLLHDRKTPTNGTGAYNDYDNDRNRPDDDDSESGNGDDDYHDELPFILHNDIKPQNIFFSEPDTLSWPRIPVAKLGDFGLAMEDNARNVNAAFYKGVGTPGFQAPEIIELPNNILTSDIPAQPAADVWTIGMTLLQLMDWRNFEVWGIVDYTRPRAEFPTLSQEAVDFYDADLVRLVHSCLKPFPWERPIATDLWASIQIAVNADPHPEDGKGLSMKQRGLGENDRLLYNADPHADWTR